MQTRTKLIVLELIGGLFGWIWIFGSVAVIYFLVAALAFNGRWSSFFWALGCSVIGKLLARGFNDSKNRVAYEAELVARGLSKEEAGQTWLQAYFGGRDQLAEETRTEGVSSDPFEAAKILVNQYGAVLKRSGELISSEELLPAPKEEIKAALILAPRAANSLGQIPPQMLDYLRVGYASLANFVAPVDAEIASHFSNLVEAGANISKANDERLREIAEGLKDSRAVEIMQRSNEEFAHLVKEFDAAVGR